MGLSLEASQSGYSPTVRFRRMARSQAVGGIRDLSFCTARVNRFSTDAMEGTGNVMG